eukprot:TRINITY_DN17259_c0_g1_i2.p1 TRINITY_DN17259_c0_g1~~TRINITY_DN17259_c0_g1_i2.p1  ORF type:complete len:215 (-),score=47.82 TRINITY_DN17259_c0_g1_i2:75-719(-)
MGAQQTCCQVEGDVTVEHAFESKSEDAPSYTPWITYTPEQSKLDNTKWMQKSSGQRVGLIRKGILMFAPCFKQKDAPLTFVGADEISMEVMEEDKTVSALGKITEDNEGHPMVISWDDGDVWVRDMLREVDNTRWKLKGSSQKVGLIYDSKVMWEKGYAYAESKLERTGEEGLRLRMMVETDGLPKAYEGEMVFSKGRISMISWSDGDTWVRDM